MFAVTTMNKSESYQSLTELKTDEDRVHGAQAGQVAMQEKITTIEQELVASKQDMEKMMDEAKDLKNKLREKDRLLKVRNDMTLRSFLISI